MYQIMFQHTNLKTKTVLTKFTMRKKEEKYGVNYRSYFRNNLPLKKDRILISELFSKIINLQ